MRDAVVQQLPGRRRRPRPRSPGSAATADRRRSPGRRHRGCAHGRCGHRPRCRDGSRPRAAPARARRAPGTSGPRSCSAPAKRRRSCRRGSSSRSQIETWCPRSRASRAAVMPAGPPPTTITCRARSRPSTSGRFPAGLRVDGATEIEPRATRSTHALHAMHGRTSTARPLPTFVPSPGSASRPRPSSTTSASPSATTRSASAGSSSRPTAITGIWRCSLKRAAYVEQMAARHRHRRDRHAERIPRPAETLIAATPAPGGGRRPSVGRRP